MGGVESADGGAGDLRFLAVNGGEADRLAGIRILLPDAVVEVAQLLVEILIAVSLEPDAEQGEHHRPPFGSQGGGFDDAGP